MKVVKHRNVLVLALLTISAVSALSAAVLTQGGQAPPITAVSIIQLISKPEAYDGKRVSITGFVRFEFEGNSIYLHEEENARLKKLVADQALDIAMLKEVASGNW